ncbi:hypothetical protein LOK49_LG06G01091 [Camellia lanceoleosa]|uniref:Uncharacterized protein n=1 Tax=Camellia lanceoleosa TaxID=1840588 RepID=A0ACC0HEN5_9ERIC|nr:hypothetical protein LOK49_LG06G01091 [Camellia lanceoleosa]
MLATIGDFFCNKITCILQVKPIAIQATRIPNDFPFGGFEFKAYCNGDPTDLKITIAMAALKFVTRSISDSLYGCCGGAGGWLCRTGLPSTENGDWPFEFEFIPTRRLNNNSLSGAIALSLAKVPQLAFLGFGSKCISL